MKEKGLILIKRLPSEIRKYDGKKIYYSLYFCKRCGNEVKKKTSYDFNRKSCGCLKISISHGLKHERIYNVWAKIVGRCSNMNNEAYHNYGGRGITICREWKESFSAFKDWADKNGYSDYLEIDRIDNDRGYSPENCKFSTRAQNARNRRSTKLKWVHVDAIRDLYKSGGTSMRKLGRVFGVTRHNIFVIVNHKTWKYGKSNLHHSCNIKKKINNQIK